MGLGKEIEKMKTDKRLTEWHVNHKKLSKEDVKKHLDALPDLASNVDSFGLGDDREDNMPTGGDLHG